MKVVLTFANRTHDPDLVELVTAWDEYSIDANYEGWVQDKQKGLGSWGTDLLNSVDVTIEIDAGPIYKALDPEGIKLQIESQVVDERNPYWDDQGKQHQGREDRSPWV